MEHEQRDPFASQREDEVNRRNAIFHYVFNASMLMNMNRFVFISAVRLGQICRTGIRTACSWRGWRYSWVTFFAFFHFTIHYYYCIHTIFTYLFIPHCNRKSHNLITSPSCKIVELSILFGFISFRPQLFFLFASISHFIRHVSHTDWCNHGIRKKNESYKPLCLISIVYYLRFVLIWLFFLLFLFLSPSILKSR